MGHRLRHKTRITAIKHPMLVKGLAIIVIFCLIVRLSVHLGSDSLAESVMSRFMQNGSVVCGILDFELGRTANLSLPPELSALLDEVPVFMPNGRDGIADRDISATEKRSSRPAPEPKSWEDFDGGLYYNGGMMPDDTGEPFPYTEEKPGNGAGIVINNTTEYAVDVQAMMDEPLDIILTRGEPAILIIHTHSSEAYTQAGGDTYEPSDPYRTEDTGKNITRIGDELTAELEKRGIGVIHDRRSYDYPSYTGSYSRALASIQQYLKEYPSIKIVLDIHRDSISGPDGAQYRTIAQIGGKTCSQVMFVVGTDSAGLTHPSWRENMKLALRMQREMNMLSPSLTRPVRLSEYRYNQHATTGSLIVEVGSAGNTLAESLTAIKYFADAAANVVLDLYE